MQTESIRGLHHITAIAFDPQRTVDFYVEVLGLRLVKRTVVQDDPGTYHLFFGDDCGAPGTIISFFPWVHASRGEVGVGEASHASFNIHPGAIGYWRQRLAAHGIETTIKARFNEEVLAFSDPDGLRIDFIADNGDYEVEPSRRSDIPHANAIRGLAGLTLLVADAEPVSSLLRSLGLNRVEADADRIRFVARSGCLGSKVDLLIRPGMKFGRPGAGSIHHAAFRVSDDAALAEWHGHIGKLTTVTNVLNRDYFHSIYFRVNGCALLELATDSPGFAVDEPIETLGETLRIPVWLESRHLAIERLLSPLSLRKLKERRCKRTNQNLS